MILRIAPLVLAVVLLAGSLALRESRPASDARADTKYSQMRSPCGRDAGVWASELGLARARELTLCLHNVERGRIGLPPLRYEPRLELAAQRYAQKLVDERFFEHRAPDGTDPRDRMLGAGYPAQAATSGENLAYGTGRLQSPVEIMDGWMHSPGHRENVLRRQFSEVGIGVVFDIPTERGGAPPGATYVANFGGAPMPAVVP